MSDERQFEIDLPPDLIAGAYADFANVWHTPTVFIMDFLTLAKPPSETVDAETGERRTSAPAIRSRPIASCQPRWVRPSARIR
jgi:hypothetical protein